VKLLKKIQILNINIKNVEKSENKGKICFKRQDPDLVLKSALLDTDPVKNEPDPPPYNR